MTERKRILWSAVAAWAVVKAIVLASALAYAARFPADASHVSPREPRTPEAFWVLGRGFDCDAYQMIARDGYLAVYARCFPPLFPLAIRAVAAATGSFQVAAVVAANLFALIAVVLFALLMASDVDARRARRACVLFACMPGLAAFGTVAYSEPLFIAAGIGAWLAYRRAVESATSAACAGWMLLAAVLAVASAMTRYLGALLPLALLAVEVARLLRSAGPERPRIAIRCAALALALLAVGAFLWIQEREWHVSELQQRIFGTRFQLLGGPAFLVADGTMPVFVLLVYATLPLVLLGVAKLFAADRPLFLFSALVVLASLSLTGVAAQSFTRFTWALWPLAIGLARVDDEAASRAIAAMLLLFSTCIAVSHVMGGAAL